MFTADYISPRTVELFGLPVDCLRENPAVVYDVIHPDDRAVFIRIHDEARAAPAANRMEGGGDGPGTLVACGV